MTNYQRYKDVPEICGDCSIPIMIHRSYYKQKKAENPNHIFRCRDCSNKSKGVKVSATKKKQWELASPEKRKEAIDRLKALSTENRNEHSLTMKKKWKDPKTRERFIVGRKEALKNMSEEQKKAYAESRQQGYQNLSDEKKEELRKARVEWYTEERRKEVGERISNWYRSLSDEDKKKFKDIRKQQFENLPEKKQEEIRKKLRNYYHQLSDEEKKIHIQKSIVWWEELTEKEKNEVNKRRQISCKRFWENIAPEEYQRWQENHILSSKLVWENLSPEEFNAWNLKRSHAQARSNFRPKETEIDFQALLNKHGIEYSCQWYNVTKHKEFDRLFQINPSTGSKRISPYHKWDFFINSPTGKILVDIDGSIHTIPPGEFIVNGVDVGLNLQFNDSQRPYQTDGLDAYVVLAYSDQLTSETEVLSFQHPNDKMNVKQLLAILTLNPKKKGEKGR